MQFTTVKIFQFNTTLSKWKAFKDMGLRALDKRHAAPIFMRHLGSGRGAGFSAIPNFGQYVVFAVWNNENEARAHLNNKNYTPTWYKYAQSESDLLLSCVHSHGSWSGFQMDQNSPSSEHKPWVILTRATIHKRKLLRFWKHVPESSKAISADQNCRFSVGVGEWPIVQQATLSVWNSLEDMKNFAYQSNIHKSIVAKTRKENWYKEEMFSRFELLETNIPNIFE